MNSPAILVLGASVHQLETIKTALKLGYRVITTDNIPSNPGHALAHRCYNIDTTDRETVLEIAKKEAVCGVISPCTDVAVPTAAYISEKLNLLGPPFKSTEIACNKQRFRDYLASASLPHPEFHRFTAQQIPDRAIFNGRSWIIKPDRSSGSKGVFIVKTEDEFKARLANALEFSPTGMGLIERFVDGHQGTCEGILKDGRVAVAWVLDRDTVAPPYAATCGHRLPSKLASDVQQELFAQLEHIWNDLKISEGLFDCDFVFDGDKIYIIELTPRMGGNSISTLLKKATGFDLVEYDIKYVCRDNPHFPSGSEIQPTAVVLFGTTSSGILYYEQQEAASLSKEPWVDSLTFDVGFGEPVRPFINGRNKIGQAFVSAKDRGELDERIFEIRRRLDVRAL